MEQFQIKSREYGGKYILGISNRNLLDNSALDIGFNVPIEAKIQPKEETDKNYKLLIINTINHDGYEIRQYENARIEVYKDGEKQPSAKEILRKIAFSLNVPIDNSAGNPKNTQQLGDHVIKAIKHLAS